MDEEGQIGEITEGEKLPGSQAYFPEYITRLEIEWKDPQKIVECR